MLLTTETLIVDKPEDEDDAAAGAATVTATATATVTDPPQHRSTHDRRPRRPVLRAAFVRPG